MKFSVFLFRENIQGFERLIHDKYLLGENSFKKIPPKSDLPFECEAYIQANKAKPPRWYDFLNDTFSLEEFDLMNISNSFILLVKRKNRIFAFTFGYGFSAIDRSKIEPNFGLKVTLNSINADQVDTLDTRNIDLVTKQKRTHLNVGSPLYEFDINTTVDWVKFISGKPTDDSLTKKLAGSDSLHISTKINLIEIGEICDEMLIRYESEEYKQRFAFIDYLQPLKQKDPMNEILNNKLNEFFLNRTSDNIAIAHPYIPDLSLTHYNIYSGKLSVELEELSLEKIYSFLDNCSEINDPLNSVYVIGLDSQNEPRTQRHKLKDFIVCEVQEDNETYVLSLNNWFKVDTDYVSKVRSRIKNLPDLSNELTFPKVKEGEHENDYNARVSKEKGWLLLDRKMFQFGDRYQKIEACDLLTSDKKFISVKKMNSSATLSHLFAQGSVSAKLFRSDNQYSNLIINKFNEKWPEIKFELLGNPIFVYSIPTRKKGRISDCLFFFSLINLIDHVQVIQAFGYQVALCKIEYE